MVGTCHGIVDTGNVLLENGARVSVTGGENGSALQVGLPGGGGGGGGTVRNLTISGGSSLTTHGEAMITGNLTIDGVRYFFNTDGSLARSTKIDEYEVDANSVRKDKVETTK